MLFYGGKSIRMALRVAFGEEMIIKFSNFHKRNCARDRFNEGKTVTLWLREIFKDLVEKGVLKSRSSQPKTSHEYKFLNLIPI